MCHVVTKLACEQVKFSLQYRR